MYSPIKILHVISTWESGIGTELAEFASRLAGGGLACTEFQQEICVLAGSNFQKTVNVPTTTLNVRWTWDMSTYIGLGRVLRRFRPDVIHTWDVAAHSYACFAASDKQHIIAEKRGTDGGNNKTHRFIVPRKDDTLSPDKMVIIPPAAVPVPWVKPLSAEEFLAKFALSRANSPSVEPSGNYYPVFQSQYDPVSRNYKPILSQATPFLIGIVLPLCSEHRILDALWVFETLNHVHLNFHAFFIGDGKDREQFLRYRDRWKLSSRVHFLGNRHDTNRLLPHFDVLLHLSPSAEQSGTILSAMSCGVPVIALETPVSREYIADGSSGILIPDTGDFRFYRRTATKRLLYLLENEELRQSMRVTAQDHVAQNFNFETAVQRRIDVYRAIRFSPGNKIPPPR